MKKFNLKPLGVIISGLVMASTSQSMFAQTTEESSDQNTEVEEIVVTGFARSIQNALDMKRNADTVVQAISSADIGGLPDVSIADALGRVPGITVTRSGGQASTVQVRGMGEGFVFSTLNGREQVSPNGTRAMEFSQFPSELINSVQVYMSPKASLIEGGVAGTVELKTANPLEMTEDQKISVGVRGSYNDQASEIYGAEPYGKRFSLSYQKKLFDDTLGLSLGYAKLIQPKAAARFEHYNYEGQPIQLLDSTAVYDRNLDPTARPPVVPALGTPIAFISDGFEAFHDGGEETRDGYMAAIQFEPNENLSIQSDIFYSKFDSESYRRGFRVQPLRNADIANVVLWENIAVVGGQFLSSADAPAAFNIQVSNNDTEQNNELLSGGLNVEWKQDALTLSGDFSHSEASGVQADGVARAHLYKPTDDLAANPNGFERDGDQQMSYLLDGINIPSFTMSRDYTDTSTLRLTNYERYPRINDDVIDAARFDLKYELELPVINSVESGIRYSERNHKDRRQVFVYGDGANGMISTDYSLPITEETSDVVHWKGDFSHFPSFLAVDGDAVMAQAVKDGLVLMSPYNFSGDVNNPIGSGNPQAYNALDNLRSRSFEPAARWSEGRSWSMLQRSDIDENVLSFYVQANIATTLGGNDLTGNIGFRRVETDQSSVAPINVQGDKSKGAVEVCDEVGDCVDDYAYRSLGVKYGNSLPSLNLNYSLTDSDQLRLALARVLSRAPINRLAAPDSAGSVSIVGIIPEFNYGSNTSYKLTPFIADQIDVSYEHYMEDTNGSVAVAAYHREIKSFIQDITIEDYDFRNDPNFVVPETWPVPIGNVISDEPVVNGNYSTAVNNREGGYIRGLELSYTQTFNFLPDLWSGLGVSGSVSLTDSKISVVNPLTGVEGANNLPFPGLVEKSTNITVFYTYENFETRLSTTYQDSFVGETRNINLQPTTYAAEMVLDYQASYKFDSGLDLVFSISNLTNEPNRSYMFDEELTRTLQWFGRTYYAGVNYTF